MYIWKYNQNGLTKPVPVVVLKTRRSIRAVHYHPHGAPIVVTAEVGLALKDNCRWSNCAQLSTNTFHFTFWFWHICGAGATECTPTITALMPRGLDAQVNAGQNSRRSPLPVESTGLEGRRERRARGERQAATPDTIAALEARLRQRWLGHQSAVPSPPAAAQVPSPVRQATWVRVAACQTLITRRP